jgi:hypothetical protein
MSGDDGTAEILRLLDEGLSAPAIAKRVGLSRATVQRRINAADAAVAELDPEDDDDRDDGPTLFDPEPVLVEPFTFCGVEIEIVQHRGEDPRPQESERWMDANKRPCSVLNIYRYWAHRAGDYGDYETGERVLADMARQRAEWERRGA